MRYMARMTHGWVYFAAVKLRFSHRRAIKIGWSVDVPTRISTLRSQKQFASLTFLGAKKGVFADEGATHRMFAEYSLLCSREIFSDVPAIREHVLSTCDTRIENFSSPTVLIVYKLPVSAIREMDREILRLERETPGLRYTRADISRMAIMREISSKKRSA